MQEKFSISHRGQEIGPFSKDEILQKIKANELSALDYIYLEEKTDWVPLAEFLPSINGARPPTAPPPGALKAPASESKAPVVTAEINAAPTAQAPLKMPPPTKPAPAMKTAPLASKASHDDEESEVTQTGLTRSGHTKTGLEAQAPHSALPLSIVRTEPAQNHAEAQRAVRKSEKMQERASEKMSEQASETKTGVIRLKDGVGTLELLQYTAGVVQLVIREDKSLGLQAGKAEELHIKAAPATRLALKAQTENSAGQLTTVTVEALDKWGNRDTGFQGTFEISLSNDAEGPVEVKLTSGHGQFSFTSKKATSILVKLVDSAKTGLDLSSTLSVKYVAGPAARLVLISPEETVAGQAVKVQVQALDQFGNLATNCNEEIKLDVTAPAKGSHKAAA